MFFGFSSTNNSILDHKYEGILRLQISHSLSDRRLTISIDSLEGAPTPRVALTALTVDGVDALGDVAGSGPWSYVVGSSASAQTVTWEVTATNDAGLATARETTVVAADLSPPAIFTPEMWSLADSPSADGDTLTLTAVSLPVDGGSAITALEYRVDSGSGYGAATALTGTATGARTITVLAETLANVQVRAVNAIGAGDWSSARTATPTAVAAVTEPAQMVAPAVAGGVTQMTVTLDGATPDGGAAIDQYEVEIQVTGASFDTPPLDSRIVSASSLPYAAFDGASFYANAPAAASNSTAGDTSGNAADLSVFIDAEFPATLAADMCFFQVAARHFFRVLANGNIQINMDDTASLLVVNLTAATDVRGGRHRIGITANAGDGVSVFPTATITVDGVVAASTTSATLGNGLFHMSRKPYALLAETVASAFGKIVPADVKVYQVGVWTNQNGAANHDWVALDAPDLDASAIGTPLLYLGGTFSGVTGAYAGALPFTLTGAAPTVTAGGLQPVVFTGLAANSYKARSRAHNSVGWGAFSPSQGLVSVTADAPSGGASIAQGDWTEVDMFDLFPAEGVVSYALQSGTVPTGMTFMADVGLLHGVPTAAGASPLTIRRTVNGSPEDLALTVTVTAGAGGATTPLAKADAVGFGRFATGGRGEAVYRVTSLSENAATSGSLPWAIAQAKTAGGGYILVEAEGALEMSAPIRIDAPNLTIDFRRAPGLGFWFTQASVWVMADNIVLKHPRSYPGSNFVGQTTQSRDCFEIMKRTDGSLLENVYVERPDALFSIDESFSIYPWKSGSTARNITLEGALVGDAMHRNLHLDEGVGGFDPHSKGPLINSTASLVTFYGGLMASLDDRSPRALGTKLEFVSSVIANYNSDALTVGGGDTAFVNNFYMYGPAIGTSKESHKLAQGIQNVNFTGIHDAGSFTGKWTQAGGFVTDGIESRWRWGNIQADRTQFLADTDNPGNFTASMSYAAALSYSDAFLTLGDRVGALNANGERHPLAQRVINYVTADVPFQAADGWHGAGEYQNAIPDEFRAVGGQIAGGSGQVTVTLPAANTALPPVADRPWTSVEVTVLDAYTMEIYDELPRSPLTLPRTSKTWGANGVTQAGSLAGGAVVFNSLPSGFYVARVTYFADSVPVRLYTGRPVTVT